MNLNPLKKLGRLRKALGVKDRKSATLILYEYLTYRFINPDLAEQYFSKYLFRKNVARPEDYLVTNKLAQKIWYYNDMKYKSLFINKALFEQFFAKHQVPVVRSFLYNINHLFYSDGDFKLVNDIDHFRKLLIDFKEKGEWTGEHLIVKKKDGSYGGRNIFKIAFADVTENSKLFEDVYRDVVKSGYLFQNVVSQHPEMNRITSSSLNTLRIDSFKNNKGEIKIVNTTLRFSCRDTFVDNVTSGGMFAGIERETGRLHGEAFSDFDYWEGDVALAHPLTGLVFKDFQIPFFGEAKKLAIDAAKLVPGVRVLGWDIGIQPTGPVLLEGNFFNDLYHFEMGQKGHSDNLIFRELLDEIDIYYNRNGNDLEEMKREYPLFV